MQKIKSINWSGFLSILKSCLIGIVFTLIGVVLFAVVLKFTDLSSSSIAYVNNIIKGISIFVIVLLIKRASNEKLLIRAGIGGIIYAILSFIIFSLLNGNFRFGANVIFDVLFAIIVAVIASVILNLLKKRS